MHKEFSDIAHRLKPLREGSNVFTLYYDTLDGVFSCYYATYLSVMQLKYILAILIK